MAGTIYEIVCNSDEPDIALLHAGTDAQSVTDTSKVTSPELYHEIENEVQGISSQPFPLSLLTLRG